MKSRILPVLFAVLALASCRDEASYPSDPRGDYDIGALSYEEIFTYYWEGMSRNYVFWDIDTTNWDAVRTRYLPKFKELDTGQFEQHKDTIAKQLFTEICNGLIDYHYSLTLYPNDEKRKIYIFPSQGHLQKRDYYHTYRAFINAWGETMRELQNKGRLVGFDPVFLVSDDTRSLSTMFGVGMLDGDIAYMRLASFELNGYIDREDVKKMLETYYELVQKPDIAGVILDLRANGGGFLSDMNLVMGIFVDSNHPFARTRVKSGPGRLDYTPWIPEYVKPAENGKPIAVPIVVLADVQSASMAEMTALAVQTLPTGVFIGERTIGSMGPIIGDNSSLAYANGGTFENDVFSVMTPAAMLSDLEGNVYEGYGITPDIECLFDPQSFANKIDNQLERAIQYIRTGQ